MQADDVGHCNLVHVSISHGAVGDGASSYCRMPARSNYPLSRRAELATPCEGLCISRCYGLISSRSLLRQSIQVQCVSRLRSTTGVHSPVSILRRIFTTHFSA